MSAMRNFEFVSDKLDEVVNCNRGTYAKRVRNVRKALKFRPFRPVAVPDFQITKKFEE
jgi:hypothetical protein